ncbi:kinase-like domain-containing protein [Rhizophagus clarus]|uniref:Kinase-like domain-containing protein n=1 Tax=Rhizophagus clarus TaxID=94130 RepID=A0A8H3KY20_9GLOM|nr:kinase-like domain-containing protein [Rhizophagus clarus]
MKYVIKSNEINLRIVLNVNLNGSFKLLTRFKPSKIFRMVLYIETRVKEAVRCSESLTLFKYGLVIKMKPFFKQKYKFIHEMVKKGINVLRFAYRDLSEVYMMINNTSEKFADESTKPALALIDFGKVIFNLDYCIDLLRSQHSTLAPKTYMWLEF